MRTWDTRTKQNSKEKFRFFLFSVPNTGHGSVALRLSQDSVAVDSKRDSCASVDSELLHISQDSAHVLNYLSPCAHANSFVIGPAVINNNKVTSKTDI
jgi:hypothetical protein